MTQRRIKICMHFVKTNQSLILIISDWPVEEICLEQLYQAERIFSTVYKNYQKEGKSQEKASEYIGGHTETDIISDVRYKLAVIEELKIAVMWINCVNKSKNQKGKEECIRCCNERKDFLRAVAILTLYYNLAKNH